MKSSFLKVIVLGLTTFAFSACDSGSTSSNNHSTNYTYDFTYNGCKTEKHDFSSKQAYCEGLKNDSLNHNCAGKMRADTYQRECASIASVQAIESFEAKYTYELSSNDCSTGTHEFSSKVEYCAALTDDNLNQNCAGGLRKELFAHECHEQ